MIKRLLLLSCVLLCLLAWPATGSAAELLPEEQTGLEQIFEQLNSISAQRSMSWLEVNKLLQFSKQRISELEKSQQSSSQLIQDLKNYISKIEMEMKNSQDSLQKANKSLDALESENKRLKAKTKLLEIVAGAALFYAATK